MVDLKIRVLKFGFGYHMSANLDNCSSSLASQYINYLINLNKLYDHLNEFSSCKASTIFNNCINNNFKILRSSNSLTHNQLLLLEAYHFVSISCVEIIHQIFTCCFFTGISSKVFWSTNPA